MWIENVWVEISDWQITSNLNYFSPNPPMRNIVNWFPILAGEGGNAIKCKQRKLQSSILEDCLHGGSDGKGHLNRRQEKESMRREFIVWRVHSHQWSRQGFYQICFFCNFVTEFSSLNFHETRQKAVVHSFSGLRVYSLFIFLTRGVMHGLWLVQCVSLILRLSKYTYLPPPRLFKPAS